MDAPGNRLYPTRTRLALLRDVADGNAIRDARDGHTYLDCGDDHPAKVTAAIKEQEWAGWVVLPDGDCVWQTTDAGAAVLAAGEAKP